MSSNETYNHGGANRSLEEIGVSVEERAEHYRKAEQLLARAEQEIDATQASHNVRGERRIQLAMAYYRLSGGNL